MSQHKIHRPVTQEAPSGRWRMARGLHQQLQDSPEPGMTPVGSACAPPTAACTCSGFTCSALSLSLTCPSPSPWDPNLEMKLKLLPSNFCRVSSVEI